MGLLSWLFPSDDQRLRKATELLERGEYARARDLVEGIEAGEEIRDQALDGLKRINIDLAIGCASAGEMERAQEHMELAEEFAKRGDPELRGARRAIREARKSARESARAPAAPSDPFGGVLSGGLALAPGAAAPEGLPDDADPIFSLPPGDPRIRFAMLMESYPEEISTRLLALGGELATAVLAIDEGHAAHAVEVLGQFVEQDDVARYERGRAAWIAGQLPLAASDLRAFGERVGHRRLGPLHSAGMLAEILASQGRRTEALEVVEAELAKGDDVQLATAQASLLEANGRFEEADEAARGVIGRFPRQMSMYKLMARCRLRANNRMGAMQALEAGLTTNCTSGRCGSQPFDVEAGRLLARLYLEDRLDPVRAEELLVRLKRTVEEPGWVEAYLDALTARNRDDPQVEGLVRSLRTGLGEGDPRRKLLQGAFPLLLAAS